MIVRGHDIEFEFAVRCCLEDTAVNLDLFDTGTIEGAQSCRDAGLFAGTRRAVDEEVRKVSALSLLQRLSREQSGEGPLQGKLLRESGDGQTGCDGSLKLPVTEVDACLRAMPC